MDAPELIAVSLARDGRAVLHGLTLTLREARIGIIGRNGAGKSQLLRLIAGLAVPDRGQVRLGGIDPATDRPAAIARIGLLFQNPDHQIIFPTVEEELSFGPREAGLPRAEVALRVRATLARFGREDWLSRHVQTLSQGQRQLLCLMAVLAMEPGTILLDEPFAGLDLATTTRLHAILGALPQRLLHVTHDLGALAGYDRVIWLDEGRVAGDGAPAPVIAAYRAAMAGESGDDRLGL
ncbi:MAG: ABC transporter ATP-binding protein [Rubellimicrobium sp.]|nr:ABC transporter ATP-binding protein [Rubellimicrobium sp.]